MGRAARLNKERNTNKFISGVEKKQIEDLVKDFKLDWVKKGIYTKFFGTLNQRKFQDNPKYMEYQKVIAIIAALARQIIKSKRQYILSGNDDNVISTFYGATHQIFGSLLLDPCFPVYALSNELVSSLWNTDYKNLGALKKPFNQCLLLIPDNLLEIDYINSTGIKVSQNDGNNPDQLRWLLIKIIEEGEHIESFFPEEVETELFNSVGIQMKAVHTDKSKTVKNTTVHWISYPVNNNNLSLLRYYGYLLPDMESFERKINSDGFHALTDGFKYPKENLELAAKINKNISRFVLNFILYLNYKSSGDTQVNIPKHSISNVKSLKEQGLEHFRYLDLSEEDKKKSNKANCEGSSHASPITHWRRGHWRNQPCGEKLQDSKIIWIQPTLINPTQE